MKQCKRRLGWALTGTVIWTGIGVLACSVTAPLPAEVSRKAAETTAKPTAAKPPMATAVEAAARAAQLAQSATTPADWSAVSSAWSEAIQALQTLPPNSPQWLFAQRKTREYLDNQAIALQRLEAAAQLAVFPTLGNTVLDEQVGLYLSYVATVGPPDIMIIGSSRALQGLNPQILQQRLAQQGHDSLQVYTFAVNGATAQVMSFILLRLLTPEQMPQMIVWAGGSRSFNSGRVDRTFVKILESPGYAAVQAGDRPDMGWANAALTSDSARDDNVAAMPITRINGYGFLAVNEVFEPDAYYRSFPRVAGIYDDSYQGFNLAGVQTVSFRAIANFTRSRDIPLVFVNLPLSEDYLDETRLFYEQQFQQFLAREAATGEFTVVDLLQEWPGQPQLFADPSHLNRVGAAQVAIKLAEDSAVPWQSLLNRADAADAGLVEESLEALNDEGNRPDDIPVMQE